jgi:hypothetical protein
MQTLTSSSAEPLGDPSSDATWERYEDGTAVRAAITSLGISLSVSKSLSSGYRNAIQAPKEEPLFLVLPNHRAKLPSAPLPTLAPLAPSACRYMIDTTISSFQFFRSFNNTNRGSRPSELSQKIPIVSKIRDLY